MTVDDAFAMQGLDLVRDRLVRLAAESSNEKNTTQVVKELDEFICTRFGSEGGPEYSTGDVVTAVAYILDELLLHVMRKSSGTTQNNTQGEDKQYAN